MHNYFHGRVLDHHMRIQFDAGYQCAMVACIAAVSRTHLRPRPNLTELTMTTSLEDIQNTKPRVSFMIVGAQKAGTTALSAFLSAHPNLFLPPIEAHYFDADGLDWKEPDHTVYEEKFDAARPGQRVGAKTPVYMYWDNSIKRIQAYNPDIKLIVVLRDPAQRAYSHWKMEVARGCESMPFCDAIRAGRARIHIQEEAKHLNKRRFSYVERGFYAPQIERIFKHFARDQLLFMTHDQMKSDLHASLDQLCAFLDVPTFQTHPRNEIIRPKLKQFNPRQVDILPPSPDDLAYLNHLYADDITATSALIGLDLTPWIEK